MMTKDLTLSQQKVHPGDEWMENTLSLIRTLWAGGGGKREQKILPPWGEGARVPWSEPRRLAQELGRKDGSSRKTGEGGKIRKKSHRCELPNGNCSRAHKPPAVEEGENTLPPAAWQGCGVTRVPERRTRVGTAQPLEARAELLAGKTD